MTDVSSVIGRAAPVLWDRARALIDDAVARGDLDPG